MNSRQLILNNIKEAVKIPSEIKLADEDLNQRIQNGISSVTTENQDGLWNQFQKELEAIAGEFHSVKNIDEAVEIISRFLVEMKLERIGVSKEKICADASEMIKKKIRLSK
jgi:L-lactate utilization protein LutB